MRAAWGKGMSPQERIRRARGAGKAHSGHTGGVKGRGETECDLCVGTELRCVEAGETTASIEGMTQTSPQIDAQRVLPRRAGLLRRTGFDATHACHGSAARPCHNVACCVTTTWVYVC